MSPEHASFNHLVEAARGGDVVAGLGDLLTVLLVLNTLLFVFNMLPFPPLDGASAIGGILPERTAVALRGFTSSPMFSLLGILVAWQIFPYFVRPLFRALLTLVHPGDTYS